jgi:DNA-binding transcriptional ArsR family regulator
MSRLSDVGVAESPADVADLVDAADVFGLLADPGRLRLLVVLLDGESSVGRLAESAHVSESSASHALRLLRAHRVVTARREGRLVYYRLGDDHVRQLLQIALQHAEHSSSLHPVGGGEDR